MDFKFDTTLERDMDLLIMEEFVSDPAFAKIFLDTIDLPDRYQIERAIHSKTDADLGESDIVFILKLNGLRHAIHIEDKIDAIAMEAQHARYHRRAQKDIANGEYDAYSVLIVAPEKYLTTNKEAQKYEYQVRYEQLRNHFFNKADLRSQYKLALIDRAIYDQKNGYQWEANPHVVRFCSAMDIYQKYHYPSLPTGTQAWWRGYKTLLPNATIVYKANKGFCDLQFSNCTPQELFAKVGTHLSPHMHIEKAAKSSSVRICVPPVNYEEPFDENIEKIDQALSALWELYQFSLQLLA